MLIITWKTLMNTKPLKLLLDMQNIKEVGGVVLRYLNWVSLGGSWYKILEA